MSEAPTRKKLRFDFSISQKILLGFGLASLFLALVAFFTYRSTKSFLTNASVVAQTHQVLEVHETLLRHLTETESGERGYIITGDPIYLLTYTSAWVLINRDLENLRDFTADNPKQLKRLAKLEPMIRRKQALVKDYISTRQIEGEEKAVALFSKGEGRNLMEQIRDLMADFDRDERMLLQERNSSFESIGRTTTFVIVSGTSAGIFILLAATWMIVRDVGARRKAEEALAGERKLLSILIETIPDRVYVKDLRGRYVLDNAAHRRYLNVQDPKEIEGKTSGDFFPAEIAALYNEDDDNVMKTDVPILNHEEPSVDRDGNLIWLATTKVPLHDTDGRLVGILCISADISDRKNADEKLRHFASQLERSNLELREFASVASHDLQEPLRKIMAFGDRLKSKCGDVLGEQGLEYLGRMQNASSRMQTLIDDLLTLSRVTSMARPFEEVDLAEIARGVMSDLEMRIERTDAKVEVGALPRIDADPLQMRQLFQNLLSNALKFQRPGVRPHVKMFARVFQAEDYQFVSTVPGGEICEITVRDNGIGFDEKYAEQIFALFQRLHGRLEYEGTGIGLSVCRKITDRHGGNIVAKSSEGCGTTFIVSLPVKQTSITPQ
jgi:PAS domain S-box-containing protein